MTNTKITKQILLGVLVSILIFGAYFEFISCILTIYFTGVYIINYKKHKFIQVDSTTIAVLIVPISYALVLPFAVDSGMAWIGFIKFMPIIPFTLLIPELGIKDRKYIIEKIPLTAVMMTIITLILEHFPMLYQLIRVNNRLSGVFQYPNTYALFCLLGVIVLVHEETQESIKGQAKWLFEIVVLCYGILESGSRTIMVILGIYILTAIVVKATRRNGIKIGILGGGLLTVAIIIDYVIANNYILNRITSISLYESTLIGRFLYAIDAIKVIMYNPMGLGYMGYHYTQGEFQTGVYDVTFVHNDILQIFLDAGWIAGIAILYVIIKTIIKPNTTSLFRTILITITAATLLDFHLQYLSIMLITLLVLNYEPIVVTKDKLNKGWNGNKYYIRTSYKKFITISIFIIIINLYMGLSLASEYLNFNSTARRLYPYNTRIYIQEMLQATDLEISGILADKILRFNDTFPYANREKAVEAFSKGDIEKAVEYKLLEIKGGKYNLTAYLELNAMMEYSKEKYQEMGLEDDVEYCNRIMESIPLMINKVLDETSPLAWMLDEKPELDLSTEYKLY